MASHGEVFQGGATTSQHIDAQDDDHFENTTFKLKRTRLLGLLDEFIPERLAESLSKKEPSESEQEQNENEHKQNSYSPPGGLSQSNTQKESVLSVQPKSANAQNTRLQSSGTQSGGDHDKKKDSKNSESPTPPFIRSPELLPHDDLDLVVEPLRHVDYLSHHWDVDDILKSWRYVILRRKNVANAARLENASWRTWAQRRCNLRTISPEEVNWLKESDVTWLYGPIVDDDDHDAGDHAEHRAFNTASSVVAGDILIARKNHGPKPILKKRTVEELMISHLNLLKLEMATARAELEQRRREDAEAQRRSAQTGDAVPEYFDYNAILAKLNSQYRNFLQPLTANNSAVDLVHSVPAQAAVQKPPSVLLSSSLAKESRHIHFNDEVQQCIAIDEFLGDDDDEYDDRDESYRDYDYGDESYIYDQGDDYTLDSTDGGDDDDEGGFFLRVRLPSSASMAGFPGLALAASKDKEPSEDTESISTNNSKVYKTIHILPPTMLNYGSSDEESDDLNPYTSSMSHNVDNGRGYDYYYDYNSVYEVDPNHAIYGKKTPDVVDVPENIALGSNFDYEVVDVPRLPILSLDDLATHTPHPLSMDASSSDEDDDDDGGLSISAKTSSQSLAQLVFGPMTAAKHYPTHNSEPEPEPRHISAINPRYSSTELSKQPHLSSSLADQFLSRTTDSALAELFFATHTPARSPPASGTLSPPVQPKTTPLPPHTTSTNAFLGSLTPPAKSFIFDSESDLDEFVEDADTERNLTSYASLAQVAGRNGITATPTDDDSKNKVGLAMANFLGSWNKGT